MYCLIDTIKSVQPSKMKRTILITGACGYLGSAICVDLARDSRIIAIDNRIPSQELRHAAPNVQWKLVDIADAINLNSAFLKNNGKKLKIDYVIHFAAYYHYGNNWRREYGSTNIKGTINIIEAAHWARVKRIIFASSIASLKPPLDGELLTENSPTNGYHPYEKSKAVGEALLYENSHKVPAVALRLGGIFSDWCELPPLYSLIKLWSKRNIIGRMIPGKGNSGFPYLHRHELVRIVRRIIEKINNLDRFDILFASEDGCTRYKDLFPFIRCTSEKNQLGKPIHISPALTRMALFGKYYLNLVLKKKTYERSWMINYIDHPLVVDTTYSRKKLDWRPNSVFYILKRLPLIMNHFSNQRSEWEKRNPRRNESMYEY
jgi:nucleoside-diphosphate-sugar epimerase